MITRFLQLIVLAFAVAGLVCNPIFAGEIPSRSDVSPATGQPIKHDGSGLTAAQSLTLASVEPGAEEAYGDMDQTTQIIIIATVCVIAIIVVASAVEWHDWD